MKYIFIDESGDLGFDFKKRGTSRYFIVACLCTTSPRSIEKLVKETHKNLRKKYKVRGVLHAVFEEKTTRIRFCKKIITKNCEVLMVYIDKHHFPNKSVNQHQLYNTLMAQLLNTIVHENNTEVEVITSRRETSRSLNVNSKNYLYEKTKITVSIKTPQAEKCLQAVDIIAWSLFRKYEHGDSTYTDILKKIIEGEYRYL